MPACDKVLEVGSVERAYKADLSSPPYSLRDLRGGRSRRDCGRSSTKLGQVEICRPSRFVGISDLLLCLRFAGDKHR